MMPSPAAKVKAAERALTHIKSGMILSLGSGSTAETFVELLGKHVRAGVLKELTLVSSSLRTTQLAESLNLTLTDLKNISYADLGVDGADEVSLNTRYVIKGGGGCALRERQAANLCRRFMIIADTSKQSSLLGQKWRVPVDVRPEAWTSIQTALAKMGAASAPLRKIGDAPFITDDGNYILDANFGPIPDPAALAAALHTQTSAILIPYYPGLT